MKAFISLVFSFLLFQSVYAQPVRLKLPRQINVPDYNHFAPSLTADGLTMIYASDYYVTAGNTVDLKIAYSKGVDNWGSGEDFPTINKFGTLNLYGGHCITADGNKVYFTSRKNGGVGGYDIWVTTKKGRVWTAPQNLGKPLNSEGSEGFPSVSADGNFLYFTRCKEMANTGCKNCKLYVSEGKGQDIWKPAQEISLNANVLYPRISKDGGSLIFSSNKAGGKGGYDLYQIRKKGEKWSAPENLSFLNTPADEIYADITSQGDALIYASKENGYLSLFRAKLPEEFHPEKVMVIAGKLTTKKSDGPLGFIQISDNNTGEAVSITRIGSNGDISAVLPAGRSYDLAVTAGNDKFYWSTTYDATNLSRSVKEEANVSLDMLEKNKIYHANKPVFDTTTFQLSSGASLECKRISKVFQSNPEFKAEIIIYPAGLTNNPPSDPEAVFNSMVEAFKPELSKSGISQEKIKFVNGSGQTEEENSYCGWAIKFY